MMNVVLMVMSRNLLTCLVVALALGTACGKGGTPTSPTGQAETETLTWSVDGTSFVASANRRAASRSGGGLNLNGSDCGSASYLGIQIPDHASVGTYRIGDADLIVSWTPNSRMMPTEWWLAPTIPPWIPGSSLSRGAGSLTISSISEEGIAGTFAFEVFPFDANREAPSKNLQGRFELAFRGWAPLC